MKRKIGGKASGLKWLKENTDLGFRVPEFRVIDTSYYDEYARIQESARLVSALASVCSGTETHAFFNPPQRLEERCNAIAKHFSDKGVSVRSSAVVSEDNEKLSGAGIYDTFFLDAEQITPKSLLEKVLQVYASVNSERALAYRRENGVEGEQMAVIVQKLINKVGCRHGVIRSRLPGRSGIIPVSWSDTPGAVVGNLNARINTAYFNAKKKRHYGNECIFLEDNSSTEEMHLLDKFLVSLIPGLKERYGKELEAEFCFDKKNNRLYLLQIRALTNLSEVPVDFPKHKKAIFRAGLSMGAGEYIGRVVFPDDVKEGWNEPEHYAFVTPRIGKGEEATQAYYSREIKRQGREIKKDMDILTPRKKAIILTYDDSFATHALTIANEKGILCVSINRNPRSRRDYDEIMKRAGPYVHIVSDGLVGRVYQATQEEAEDFNQRVAPQMARI